MMRTVGFVITLFLLTPLLFFCSDGSRQVNEKSEKNEKDAIKGKRKNAEETNEISGSEQDDEFIYDDSLSEYINAYNKTLSLFELPVREKDVPTQFGNAHVLICGKSENPPVVLLHGMNASSTMWYPNMKTLAKNYCVYAIDFLLEPGKSTCNTKRLNKKQIADWYDEVFSKLGLKSVYLVGCSRGGWLAVAVTLNKPEKIKKLVLLSPAQTFTWIPPSSALLSNITYSISPDKDKLGQILSGLSVRSVKINKTYFDQYYLGTEKDAISSCIFQMTPYSRKSVETLSMPVLVLIGDKDIINNQRCLDKAKKWLPNVQTGTIENAGHFLSFDQPDTVNLLIRNFLKE
ncbi:alpha/beta fold hydrolase [Fluviicola chungangensis]|uniref:Alpha/beta hydrolase n=1 Tax=Fluviicola chungangensis TaxID=2597671 RepID=A0A556MPZ2_9FLAO|nr:alpha/beta hydrolase [Fluviicola chungangensis]TSJ41902.1 alpha/beta hydrolase [Fluviicola chungangensis]